MSYETKSCCADLVLTDAIQILVKETNMEQSEIRKAIMMSEAYDALYDFETGLWQDGPAYFVDYYTRSTCGTQEHAKEPVA